MYIGLHRYSVTSSALVEWVIFKMRFRGSTDEFFFTFSYFPFCWTVETDAQIILLKHELSCKAQLISQLNNDLQKSRESHAQQEQRMKDLSNVVGAMRSIQANNMNRTHFVFSFYAL